MWQDIKMLNATADVLFGMLALALLVTSFWWLGQRPMFALKVIRIEGTAEVPLRFVNRSTVKGTAVPRIKGNFFTVNLDAVRTAFESVPWVRKATVRREWPNKLIVTLEEHIPLGTWGEDGRLLSVKGDVFTANLAEAEEDGELPALAGPIGSEKEVVEVFRDLHDWFAPARLKPASLHLSGRYAWTVGLDNGMKVELGREQSRETLKARVDRLMGIYPQLVARLQDRIESIDMRYPNGLALTARGLTIESDVKNKQ
jgi:cell division protein FtsQ